MYSTSVNMMGSQHV